MRDGVASSPASRPLTRIGDAFVPGAILHAVYAGHRARGSSAKTIEPDAVGYAANS